MDIVGNIKIAEETYIKDKVNQVCEKNTRFQIFNKCEIGLNSKYASNHRFERPVADEQPIFHLKVENDVVLENSIWLIHNIIILSGTCVESLAIISTNSTVSGLKKLLEKVLHSPVEHIRFNTDHYLYPNSRGKWL